MIVYLLTEEQKNLLIGREFTKDSEFNPIQDINDNWIISIEEVELASYKKNIWVKDLPEIEYKAKEIILELKAE